MSQAWVRLIKPHSELLLPLALILETLMTRVAVVSWLLGVLRMTGLLFWILSGVLLEHRLLRLLFHLLLPALVLILGHRRILSVDYLSVCLGHSHMMTIIGHRISERRFLILADWTERRSLQLRLMVIKSCWIDFNSLFGLDLVRRLYFVILVERLRYGLVEVLLRQLALVVPGYFEIVNILGLLILSYRGSLVLVKGRLVRSEVLHVSTHGGLFWISLAYFNALWHVRLADYNFSQIFLLRQLRLFCN